MPGPAVGFGVGKGTGQSTVQLPPPVRKSVTVDGRPGERVPELDPGIVYGDEARRLGGNQVGQLQPEQRRGAGQHRHLATVDGGGESEDVAGALRKSRQPHQVYAGDAGPCRERRVRRQVGQALAFGAQLQERKWVPAGLAVETVGELLAQRPIPWCRSSSAADPRSRPGSRMMGRSAPSSSDCSSCRTARKTATGSAMSGGTRTAGHLRSTRPASARRPLARLPALSPNTRPED